MAKAAAPVNPAEPTFNPGAIRFPDMQPEHFDELVEDIRRHGQRRPIITDLQGRFIDGLHRYRACLKLGIEPKFDPRDVTEDEARALSMSENRHRRHLTPGQWAAIAEENAKRTRGGDQTANLRNDPSTAALATTLGVSPRSVQTVREVRKKAPELLPDIKSGKLAPHAAKQIANLPEPEREEAISKVKRGDIKAAKAASAKSKSKKSPPVGGKLEMPGLIAEYAILNAVLKNLPGLPDELRSLPSLLNKHRLAPAHAWQLKRALRPILKMDFTDLVAAAHGALAELDSIIKNDPEPDAPTDEPLP